MNNITRKIIILLTSFVMACGGGGGASTSVSTTNTTAQTGSQSSTQSNTSGSATATGELGLSGAATYKLDSMTDVSNGSSVTLTLVASDGSVADGVTWAISSIPAIAVNQSSVALNKLTISLTNPQNYQTYSVLVTANRNGQAFTKTISFWPSFSYNNPSTRIPLAHSHYETQSTFGERIERVYQPPFNEFNAFDSNGWVNRKITFDFPGFLKNDDSNGPAYNLVSPISSFVYDGSRKKAYLFYPDKNQDKLVFMSINEAPTVGTYKVLDFGQTVGTYGKWTNILLADYWLIARTVLTNQTGSSADKRKINVHVYKFDYEGNFISSNIVETSNIPNFGYAETTTSVGSQYFPNILLERHYRDVIISGVAFSTNNLVYQSSSFIWIPLDPSTLTLKSPFWVQIERFRKEKFTNGGQKIYYEQPEALSTMSSLGGGLESSLNTLGDSAWSPQGQYGVFSNYLNYSSADINEGWYSGSLSSDYSSLKLTTYGVKELDTSTDYFDYSYRWNDSNRLIATKSTSIPNTIKTLIGNSATLYRLPEVNVGTASCNMYGQANGLFNFGSDCNKYESFYGMDSVIGPVARQGPSPFNIDYAGSYTQDASRVNYLNMKYTSDSDWRGPWMYLDANFRHPGCTTDIPYTAPTITPVARSETTFVRAVQTPALLNAPVVNATAGPLTITVTPYQQRSPVLCSIYKISLDQTLTVVRASPTGNLPTVAPVLHSIYSRQLILAPTNGVYDTTKNIYSPNRDFNGTDTFKIRINDGSGTQDVTVVVKVL